MLKIITIIIVASVFGLTTFQAWTAWDRVQSDIATLEHAVAAVSESSHGHVTPAPSNTLTHSNPGRNFGENQMQAVRKAQASIVSEIATLSQRLRQIEDWVMAQREPPVSPKATRDKWEEVRSAIVTSGYSNNPLKGITSAELRRRFGPPDKQRVIDEGVGWYYNFGAGSGWDAVRVVVREGHVTGIKFYDSDK